MIPRVLELEVMNTAEEACDYDAMDHTEVNRVFVREFLEIWDGAVPILDVGTGTAQIPIELCRQSPDAKIIGIDLSEQMLALGNANVQKARLNERIRLELVDAKAMRYADGHFAAVVSNSIIHHIPSPAGVLAEMARVVRSGGTIFVRDLLRPESGNRLRELVTLYAGESNEHQQKMFAESLHAALTLDEIRKLVSDLGLESGDVRQTTDRHWTWASRRK